MAATSGESLESGMNFVTRIFNEIVTSPLNIALLGAIGLIVYRMFKTHVAPEKVKPEEPQLPKVLRDLYVLLL